MSKREKISFDRALDFIQRFGYSVHRRLSRKRGEKYPVYIYQDPTPRGMKKHYELEEWLDDEHYNILYDVCKSATPRLERRLTKAEEMEKPISEEFMEEPDLKEISERCMKLKRQLTEEEKYIDYEMTRKNLLSQEETLKKGLEEKREERKGLERGKIVEWFNETIKREFPFLFCSKCGVAVRFVEVGDKTYRINYELWLRLYGADYVREKGLILTGFRCPKCGVEGFVRCRKCNVGQLYIDGHSLILAFVRCNACQVEDDVYRRISEEYKKSWRKRVLQRIWNDEDTTTYDIFDEEFKRLWGKEVKRS